MEGIGLGCVVYSVVQVCVGCLELGGLVGAGWPVSRWEFIDVVARDGTVFPHRTLSSTFLKAACIESVNNGVAVAWLGSGAVESAVKLASSVFVVGG